MSKRQMLTGAAAIGAVVLCVNGVLAASLPSLDRVLRKADPGAELVADFNELVSTTNNIAPPSPSPDQDKAKAAEIRTLLQDPGAIAQAGDPSQRAIAENGPEMKQIPALASKLDQAIGTRLSADAKTGVVNDFTTISQFMAIAKPNANWYCGMSGLGVLLGC